MILRKKKAKQTTNMLVFFFRDLKRDVSKKLEKLEKRTQRAIVELIRKSFLEYHDCVIYGWRSAVLNMNYQH